MPQDNKSNKTNKINSIMLVAGELSGDQIGANLVKILRKKYPKARIYGVVGPKMQAAGCEEIGNINQLSVMGLVEVIKHLPRILKFKKKIVQYAISNKPDLYIGIDSPDFNLRVAHSLKSVGIKTIQHVSPTVWAWRQGRIKGIKRAVDHVCCLFPFEVDFYKKHDMPASFVGHPISYEYDIKVNKDLEQKALGLEKSSDKANKTTYIALLPGSRVSEVTRMLPIFLAVADKLSKRNNNIRFLIPRAHKNLKTLLDNNIANYPDLQVKVFEGEAQAVLKSSQIALITSGTATLEALMAKTLMVVAYVAPSISYLVYKHLVKTPYIGLPNILAGKMIVPEFIQKQATVDNLVVSAQEQIDILYSKEGSNLLAEFAKTHQSLRVSSDVLLDVIARVCKD
jgi:lipid-A-disaccharide synthase